MAEKKTTAQQTAANTRTRKASPRRKKAANPKVTLSARKVYVLCAVIICVCGLSLAFSVITALPIDASATTATRETPPALVADRDIAVDERQASADKRRTAKETAGIAALRTKDVASETATDSGRKPQDAEHAPVSEMGDGERASAASAERANERASGSASHQKTPTKTSSVDGTSSQPTTGRRTATVTQQSARSQATTSATAHTSSAAQTTQQVPSAALSFVPDSSTALALARPATPLPSVSSGDPFDLPPAQNGATLVFVIDDAGLHVENVRRYTALPFPITIAVLPKLAESERCAAQVRADGKELMLHQPMQAVNLSINPGTGKISPDMTSAEVIAQIRENLASLGGGVRGFNNHEGSLITEDVVKMRAVLETAAGEGIYFLDSRTTAQSTAREVALERDMRIFERNAPFLDNAVTREDMLAEIRKGLVVANKAGYAIIIGHVDKSVHILPVLLEELYPHLVQKGYRFATPSTL